MVNAPFIQKYTIPKAQWKSLVEATSLWVGEKELKTGRGSFHTPCSYGSCPSVLRNRSSLQGLSVPGREGQWPTQLQSPWLSDRKHVRS